MECSVHCPSSPNTYSYVRAENLGSTRKFVQNYLLFTCISNLILEIHTQIVNGLKEPFSDSREKFLQPMRSGCMASIFMKIRQIAYACRIST
jgi:hypothetical protein